MSKEPVIMNEDNIPEVRPNPDPMLAMIDKVCANPDFDIAKMERLIEMRNAELSRVAETEFNTAFAEVQPLLPRVISRHRNTQTNSNYAKIEDINQDILPIISKYGFGILFKVLSQDKEGVTVRATLRHSSGHQESTDLFVPYDRVGAKGSVNKTMIHATGSTISYAKRYAMCMLLDISTGDDNDAQHMNEFISEEQALDLEEKLEELEADKAKFINGYMKVNSLREIPLSKYGKAIKGIQAKKKAKNDNS